MLIEDGDHDRDNKGRNSYTFSDPPKYLKSPNKAMTQGSERIQLDTVLDISLSIDLETANTEETRKIYKQMETDNGKNMTLFNRGDSSSIAGAFCRNTDARAIDVKLSCLKKALSVMANLSITKDSKIMPT